MEESAAGSGHIGRVAKFWFSHGCTDACKYRDLAAHPPRHGGDDDEEEGEEEEGEDHDSPIF